MVEIKYIGHWQKPEIKNIIQKKAQVLVNTGNWEFVESNKTLKIPEIEQDHNGNSIRSKKRRGKSNLGVSDNCVV